tara:strand:+ start:2701 stop:3648 length:948 start_codon:yes stop_codon:yes gene_type:complete
MKTVLVTGGAGFIGSHLVDRLLEEYEVVCIDDLNDYYDVNKKIKNVNLNIDKENYHFFCVDLRDGKALRNVFEKFDFSIVIHLAARAGVQPSLKDPFLYEEVNIRGTLNIFDLCREFNVKKVVAASSSSVYGANKKIPFSENDNVDIPISPYAATKKADELFGAFYSQVYGMDVVMLRFFTVYGPRGRPDMVIYLWCDGIFKEKEISVRGDEDVSRDFTYIDDIVDGIIRCFNVEGFSVLNLGNSNPVKIRELLKIMETEIGKKAKVKYVDLPQGDVKSTYADISRAKEVLGWGPEVDIKEGVKRTIDWYRENEL